MATVSSCGESAFKYRAEARVLCWEGSAFNEQPHIPELELLINPGGSTREGVPEHREEEGGRSLREVVQPEREVVREVLREVVREVR